MTAPQIILLLLVLPVVGYLVFLFFRTDFPQKDLLADRKRVLANQPDTIVTVPGIVISYRPNPKKLETFVAAGSQPGVSEKLREMLAANPSVDLAKFADSLGIAITNVERRKTEEGTFPGIVIGHD